MKVLSCLEHSARGGPMTKGQFLMALNAAIEIFEGYESDETLKRILVDQGIWFDNEGRVMENPVAVYVEKVRFLGDNWNETRLAQLELAWEHYDRGQQAVAIKGKRPSQI